MTIIIKAVPLEAHWSIEIVERFHLVLKRVYKMIMKDLTSVDAKVSKELELQMTVKTINDTADSNGLVLTLLVFDAYSRMHHLDSFAPNIIQRVAAISKAMGEMKKIMAEKQVRDALNIKNGSIVNHFHDLSINSEVLVWRENNAKKSEKSTDSFKMQDMEKETCKIAMFYEIIDFRNIVIKSFFRNESENVKNVKNENTDHVNEKIEKNENSEKISEKISQSQDENEKTFFSNSSFASKRDRDRSRKLSLRYRDFETNISIFLQDLQNDSLMQNMQTSTSIPIPFVKSRKKKINDLFEKNCFEIVSISDVFHEIKIFNSRFVDEIKNINTVDAYEKFRLIMQTYNDDDKAKVLIQTPTIQRINQRLILTLTVNMSHLNLFLRNISQAYVQSTISLTRKFFIRPPIELKFGDAIFKIIKPLYEVPEAGIH